MSTPEYSQYKLEAGRSWAKRKRGRGGQNAHLRHVLQRKLKETVRSVTPMWRVMKGETNLGVAQALDTAIETES